MKTLLSVMLVLCFAVSIASAQETRGTISGHVRR